MTQRKKMGKRRKRRVLSAEKEAEILRRHNVDKAPISDEQG